MSAWALPIIINYSLKIKSVLTLTVFPLIHNLVSTQQLPKSSIDDGASFTHHNDMHVIMLLFFKVAAEADSEIFLKFLDEKLLKIYH